jgi:hypothetical protein
VTQLYASTDCSLLNDWLLMMVKINSVKNRKFVLYDTEIVYIVVMMVVRQSHETKSRETEQRDKVCCVKSHV